MSYQAQLQSVLAAFNSLRLRKPTAGEIAKGITKYPPLTENDFFGLEKAKDIIGMKSMDNWDDAAVFITTDTLGEFYRRLTPKSRDILVMNEWVGGWFDGCRHDDCDEDDQFCSTPSHCENVPSVADYQEDIEHCSRSGVVFIYPCVGVNDTPGGR